MRPRHTSCFNGRRRLRSAAGRCSILSRWLVGTLRCIRKRPKRSECGQLAGGSPDQRLPRSCAHAAACHPSLAPFPLGLVRLAVDRLPPPLRNAVEATPSRFLAVPCVLCLAALVGFVRGADYCGRDSASEAWLARWFVLAPTPASLRPSSGALVGTRACPPHRLQIRYRALMLVFLGGLEVGPCGPLVLRTGCRSGIAFCCGWELGHFDVDWRWDFAVRLHTGCRSGIALFCGWELGRFYVDWRWDLAVRLRKHCENVVRGRGGRQKE